MKKMQTSQAFLADIRASEGTRKKAYKDTAGKLTIGVGHLLTDRELFDGHIIIEARRVDWRKGLSDEEIGALLRQDYQKAERIVNAGVKVPVTQNQFDAMVSLAFNIGEGNFRTSTLLKLVNNSNFPAAAQQFARWNKETVNGQKVENKGLAARRKREADLFLA